MADFVFDLNADYPDVVVDTMRRAVLAALADLQVHADQLDASLLLVETTYDVAQTFLTTVLGIQTSGGVLEQTVTALGQTISALGQTVAAQQDALTALTARVAALEPPPADPPIGGTA